MDGVISTYYEIQPFPLDLHGILALLTCTSTIQNLVIYALLLWVNIHHGTDELFSNKFCIFNVDLYNVVTETNLFKNVNGNKGYSSKVDVEDSHFDMGPISVLVNNKDSIIIKNMSPNTLHMYLMS